MVTVGRRWSAEAGRAARDNRALYTRLLFLSGIIAVAWLAGGIGVAHGDAAPGAGELTGDVADLGSTLEGVEDTADEEALEGVEDTADEEAHGSRLSDTAARGAGVTEYLTEELTPRVTALPTEALEDTAVSTVLDRTRTGEATGRLVDEGARVVDETMSGAGGLVTDVARTGQELVEDTDGSLRETGLVDTIADGLSEPVRGVDRRVGEVMTTATVPRVGDGRASSELPDPAREEQETGEVEETSPIEGSTTVLSRTLFWQEVPQWHTAAGESVEQADPAANGDLGARIRLIGGGTHHSAGTDTTAASGPSFSGPGAAGFLMNRVAHLAPTGHQAALPGDHAAVVRDAADDPSYSPD